MKGCKVNPKRIWNLASVCLMLEPVVVGILENNPEQGTGAREAPKRLLVLQKETWGVCEQRSGEELAST